MTDTPETDNLARGNHVVPTEFAQQLERERDEWKQKYFQQNKDLGYELLDPNGTIWSECKRLQTELTTVTEQKDRLTEVLQSIRIGYGGQITDPDCGCDDCKFLIEIDTALQSLTNNHND
jgi:hypothetical protein